MNLPTVIVLLVVTALAIAAVLTLRKGKDACTSGENAKKNMSNSKCASCAADCPLKR